MVANPLRWPVSVRARTTIAATTVVALALALTGVLVVSLLRHNLVGNAEMKAEYTARSIAEQLAAGTPTGSLDLSDDDDELAQIVDANGNVVGAGEALADAPPVGDFAPQSPSDERDDRPSPTDDGDDDDDDDDDQDDDDGGQLPTSGAVGSDVNGQTVTVSGSEQRYQFVAMTARTPSGEDLAVYSGVSLTTEDEAISDVTGTMWLVLPALLGVVALVTWLVTGRALRPVSAIRTELAEITAGDLSRRVPEPAARDEIYALARTTNETLGALDSAVSQQRRFIADASHELRSPLAILRAQFEVASSHPELLDMDATLADIIRLQTLATDLLMLARLDAGERPEQARIDLSEMVHEEIARRAPTDRVPVRLTADDNVAIAGVRGQWDRVLTNLVDNAQRHARQEVTVSMHARSDQVVIEVGDDGGGIPPAEAERIFDRFVRLDESRNRDEGGAGLGLAIVRDVVSTHHGTIAVGRSAAGGALFTIRVPRADDGGVPTVGTPSGTA